ncbi:MAG: hypothetical protein ACLSVD_19715, partial [Eggerthellaceae bacterium]
LNKKIKHFIDVVVDRVQLKASATSRIAEAVELATRLADGRVLVQVLGDDGKPLGEGGGRSSGATGGLGAGEHIFSLALACPEHGHSMDELQPHDFSFNALWRLPRLPRHQPRGWTRRWWCPTRRCR